MRKIGVMMLSASMMVGSCFGGHPFIAIAEEAQSVDDLPDLIEEDIETAVESLTEELDRVLAENDTYENYVQNHEQIDQLYEYIDKTDKELCIKLRERSVEYVKLIIGSGESDDDMYDALEDLYDYVYDDASSEVYDQIYDGILEDMYDEFYDGVLDDVPDDVPYKDWSDARSHEYKQWSNARSDAYDEYSDLRSDVYKFWSDVRNKIWSGDVEKVEKRVAKFEKNIAKLKEKLGSEEESEAETEENTTEISEESSEEALVDGMRPSFKAAMDSYEQFYDSYCEILKQYQEDPSNTELLQTYTNMLVQLQEMNNSFEKWDDEDLNDVELKYYLDVNIRVMQKLTDAMSTAA